MINDIRLAFANRLSSVWAGDIAWSGNSYVPKSDTPYISANIPAVTRQAMGLGVNAPRQWRGTWQMVVVMPSMAGEGPAYDSAWAIAQQFPRGTVFPTVQGLTILNADVRPLFQDTDFHRVPVLIDWYLLETTP